MEDLKCPCCDGRPMRRLAATTTLAGYDCEDGHDHDTNDESSTFRCENNHLFSVSKRHRCPLPSCDWKHPAPGKEEGNLWVDDWPAHIRGEPHSFRTKDGRWFSLIEPFFFGAKWVNADGSFREEREDR